MTKEVYETPMLREHGKVEDITKATASGACYDDNQVAGTPVGFDFGDCS